MHVKRECVKAILVFYNLKLYQILFDLELLYYFGTSLLFPFPIFECFSISLFLTYKSETPTCPFQVQIRLLSRGIKLAWTPMVIKKKKKVQIRLLLSRCPFICICVGNIAQDIYIITSYVSLHDQFHVLRHVCVLWRKLG